MLRQLLGGRLVWTRTLPPPDFLHDLGKEADYDRGDRSQTQQKVADQKEIREPHVSLYAQRTQEEKEKKQSKNSRSDEKP